MLKFTFTCRVTGSVRHDAGLISAFLDRLHLETHTFHLRFGEATVTLEDVYYILGLRSVGRPVLPIPGDAGALLLHELLGVAPDLQQDTDVIKKGEIKIGWLVHHFGDCSRLHSATGHDHEPPRQRDAYLMQHPRALRWMVPLDGTTVQTYSLRGIRYDLDMMSEDSFRWRPYDDCAVKACGIPELELLLMSAPYPLIYLTWVEWCYTDRVTRQFGYLQQVPTDSLLTNHDSFHRGQRGWPFQFTRVEGFSAVYHQIQGSGVAEDDDTMDEALQGLHGTLNALGFLYLLQRPPHPPPTTPRTSGAHARRPGTAFLHVAPAPQDGWEPWPRPSAGEDSSGISCISEEESSRISLGMCSPLREEKNGQITAKKRSKPGIFPVGSCAPA
ncbi:hypothetical protein AgCh_028394 [Apium graveolens]